MFIFVFCLLLTTLVFAQGQSVGDTTFIEFHSKNAKYEDAKNLYHWLNVPIQRGTFLTDKKHHYKLYQDSEEQFTFYCAKKFTQYDCFISLKNDGKSEVYQLVENSEKSTKIVVNDYKEAKRLYEMLKVEVLAHGNWFQKVIFDEENWFGISCITNAETFSDYRCTINIFKK